MSPKTPTSPTADRDETFGIPWICLLYTSDAADEEDSVDLGGRRIIQKKQKKKTKKEKQMWQKKIKKR